MQRVLAIALLLLSAIGCAGAAPARPADQALDLAGTWRFALDRADQGIQQQWFKQDLQDKIALPGILQAQGYGDDIDTSTPWVLSLYDKQWDQRQDYQTHTTPGKVKVPFLSQPPKHYLGAAWYQRDVAIPTSWRGQRVVLRLERPRWGSTVWVDERKVGENLSLVAEHDYDLGLLAPGRHRVSIRVDNRMLMAYRPDAHSVSDSLGMSWNGIIGKLELRATSPVWIDDAQVYPNVQDRTALLKIKLGNASGRAGIGSITANGVRHPVRWTAAGGSAEVTVKFAANAPTWDEFHPVLHDIRLQLQGPNAADTRDVRFGFAQIAAVGKDFVLNGRTIFLRGTHHGGDFPLTGYPPTDVAYWRKIMQINKDWGINHIRFHSFCPPEAAFQAADELGVYLQPEPGMWNDVSPGTPMEAMLYQETERMIRAYGNHPSFLLLSPSNEPKGKWKQAFDRWIAHYRLADPWRLYTNGTGHTEKQVPGLAEGTDYLAMQRIGPKPLRGERGWFGRDYGASLDGINVPVVSHETGQWVAYPDYDIIDKFTGYLRPGNYEIFRDSLARHGMAARNKDFAWASGKFQLQAYKEEIEANLRTPGLSGYQLLDLHDYLGQGTALVGLLDTFWEPKGYVTAPEFRRFNGTTVPLARLAKRVYTTADSLIAPVEVAHFGAAPLVNAQPRWQLLDTGGRVAASGDFARQTIAIGKNIALGTVTLPLRGLAAPQTYRLEVTIEGAPDGAVGSASAPKLAGAGNGAGNSTSNGAGFAAPHGDTAGGPHVVAQNDWRIWVYPAAAAARKVEPADVLITRSWAAAEARLAQGGKVLYLPLAADLDWSGPPLDSVPVFWNRLMNPAWSRTLGVAIDNRHPALAHFPTDRYNDWQWTELIKGARTINLDRLPAALQPIVQPVDDWNRNYKLGLLVEAKVGTGRLMIASADLVSNLDQRNVARQLRQSVLDYMASNRFDPQVAITAAEMRLALFDTLVMKKLGAQAAGGNNPAYAIDGDPNTFWNAGDQKAQRVPQSLTISFATPATFSGLVIMPRQNHRDHEGDVRDYLVETSDDGASWQELQRGALVSTYDQQRIAFGRNVTARQLRFTALSGFGTDNTAALAEVALVYTGAPLPENSGAVDYKRVQSASSDIDENLGPAEPKKPAK
ncbi:discoidin domain-containing protein [Duganella phyllosphaerae]|uniref:Beta-glucuronidase n=1 Tax=Duganella phyllosphaerae TaxID=762836 RepID=A0A1E7W8R7_9BURK|nr:discoidin domain-containing protein [Duganella phyllosphaerae]OEZ92661.1 beta-glucuronidase [Duganella phyllosphaerae]